MLYMFLLYWGGGETPPSDMSDVLSAHLAVTRTARERGAYLCSEALGDGGTATTVRVRNGKTVTTDGPFVETKEVLGGFYLLDCRDLDEALAYAARIPDARYGAVEVRPVRQVPNWPYEHWADRRRQPMDG